MPIRTSGASRPRLVLLITEDWYYWSHRRSIAVAAIKAGYEVVLLSRFVEHRERIEADGVRTVDVKLRRAGRNPFGELAAVADLVRIYRRERPDVVHHVAIKPILYGAWAARIARVGNVVNAVSGLGYAFTGEGRKARVFGFLARLAYRTALSGPSTWTIFQNDDDRRHLLGLGLLAPERAVLIRGSGVDLRRFTPSAEPDDVRPVVLYAGRMLWSKGVGDLVDAARLLRRRGIDLVVQLFGHSDVENPEAIPTAQLDAWVAAGDVDWMGRIEGVAGAMAAANVVVLASEREGIPKVLIEAAAAARSVVATNVPGCRDVIADGVNGILIPVHDPQALAEALERLILDPEMRKRMGEASRVRAETEFSEDYVVGETLALYSRVMHR